MLRYRADIRTLGMLTTYAVLAVAGFIVRPTGWLAAAWVLTTACVSWFCAVIAHNVVHAPVFKQRWIEQGAAGLGVASATASRSATTSRATTSRTTATRSSAKT